VLPGDFVYRIQLATVVARVVSCTVNFTINKKIVFRKEGSLGTTAVKYFVLAVAVMLISANAVNWLYGLLHWPELLIKIIVDCTLFVFNYVIQKKLIFKK
ncbi:MAG: GtrA family protein, partial [Clostridia bacterium]|nr:GtrA family protein [Clostridia bacterium]